MTEHERMKIVSPSSLARQPTLSWHCEGVNGEFVTVCFSFELVRRWEKFTFFFFSFSTIFTLSIMRLNWCSFFRVKHKTEMNWWAKSYNDDRKENNESNYLLNSSFLERNKTRKWKPNAMKETSFFAEEVFLLLLFFVNEFRLKALTPLRSRPFS